MRGRVVLVVGSGLVIGLSVMQATSDSAEFFRVKPEEYRSWNHVKSMVIHNEKHPLYNPFSGIHHIYINDRGLKVIQKKGKRKFPEGTVIAIVFYRHRAVDNNTAYVEGIKRIEAFMVKNSGKFGKTGGWGYYAYDGKGKPLVKDMLVDCHSCHSQVRSRDYVFSVWTR